MVLSVDGLTMVLSVHGLTMVLDVPVTGCCPTWRWCAGVWYVPGRCQLGPRPGLLARLAHRPALPHSAWDPFQACGGRLHFVAVLFFIGWLVLFVCLLSAWHPFQVGEGLLYFVAVLCVWVFCLLVKPCKGRICVYLNVFFSFVLVFGLCE